MFSCPNCNALYQLVKTEAGPETDDREITCRACGGPLPARDGGASASTSFCGRGDAPIHESGFSDAPGLRSGGEARRIAANVAKLPELLRSGLSGSIRAKSICIPHLLHGGRTIEFE